MLIYFVLAGPDAFPKILNVTAVSNRSVYVQWDMLPLISQNGIIVNYSIFLDPVNATYQIPVMDSTSDLYIIVEDLIPGTSYNVSVTAFTRVGPGPPCPPVKVVMTPEDGKLCKIYTLRQLSLLLINYVSNAIALSSWASANATSSKCNHSDLCCSNMDATTYA